MTPMATSLATRRADARVPEHLRRSRVVLDDGLRTTVYLARYELAQTALRVARPRRPVPLATWCESRGVQEALVGGFFTRPDTAPLGELLQAGPVLVREGEPAVRDGEDPEGFSAGAAQFDSDITAGRYPRAALGIADGTLLAVVCDGRSRVDAGLSLAELAALLVDLGAREAINLDGGGSTSLVCAGELRNRPRADFGVPLPGGRPIATALVFAPR
jgi:uncharacterized membrane protein (UPF0136 family)